VKSATFTFNVTGDSYSELQEKADAIVVEFLRDEDSEQEHLDVNNLESFFSVDYDMTVDENQDMEVDSDYRAQVTSRIKPRR